MKRLIERETLAGSFLVRRNTLLPRSFGGEQSADGIGTLHRPRASSETRFRKEEGWNHERACRPFSGMAFFYMWNAFCAIVVNLSQGVHEKTK